jgi:hypothetical protein
MRQLIRIGELVAIGIGMHGVGVQLLDLNRVGQPVAIIIVIRVDDPVGPAGTPEWKPVRVFDPARPQTDRREPGREPDPKAR